MACFCAVIVVVAVVEAGHSLYIGDVVFQPVVRAVLSVLFVVFVEVAAGVAAVVTRTATFDHSVSVSAAVLSLSVADRAFQLQEHAVLMLSVLYW